VVSRIVECLAEPFREHGICVYYWGLDVVVSGQLLDDVQHFSDDRIIAKPDQRS